MKQKYLICLLLIFLFIFQSCVFDSPDSFSESQTSNEQSSNEQGSMEQNSLESQDISIDDQSSNDSQPDKNIDNWSGEYGYNRFNDVSYDDSNYSDYYLSIYKEDDQYIGHLVIDGVGFLNHDFYIYFEGDETKLDGYFKEGDPNKPYSSTTEPGTKVFSLIKKDGQLYTVLYDYDMYDENDNHIEKEVEKIIFFKKDIPN